MFFVGAQHAAPLFSKKLIVLAQDSPKQKPAAQSKSQKVANPLNELLDEAKRDDEGPSEEEEDVLLDT